MKFLNGLLNGLLAPVVWLLALLLRGVLAVVVWLVATVLMVVSLVLCVTVLLLPLGIPLLHLSRRLFSFGIQLLSEA
jgi:hypothetical protein